MIPIGIVKRPWHLLDRLLEKPFSLPRELDTGTGGIVLGGQECAIANVDQRHQLHPRIPPIKVPAGTLIAYDFPWPGASGSCSMEIVEAISGERSSLLAKGFLTKPDKTALKSLPSSGATSPELALYRLVHALVNNAQELRSKAEEAAATSKAFGNKTHLVLLPIPWADLTGLLASDESKPTMGLIVRLVQQIGEKLVQLCNNLRHVLRRVRKKAAIGRVQQVDSACLQWLVRQPGRTPVEKAGPRQEIMAIEREDSYNTLENRVVKDLLVRTGRLCREWLEINKKHVEHTYYKMVWRFQRRTAQLLKEAPFTDIAPLPSSPSPNNVLLHDPRYHEIWEWYMRLVQQEEDSEAVWPWQARLWSETVKLYASAALILSASKSGAAPIRHQSLWLRSQPQHGRWIEDLDWPGPLVLKHGTRTLVAECLVPATLSAGVPYLGTDIGKILCTLGADFVLHLSELRGAAKGIQLCVLAWALHGAVDREAPQASLLGECRDASKQLDRMQNVADQSRLPYRFVGILAMSDASPEYTLLNDFAIETTGTSLVYGIRVPGRADEWSGTLLTLLKDIMLDAIERTW